MKLIRFFIISLFVFAVLITALSFLIPSRLQISRTRTIHASMDRLWQVVDNMKTWHTWNPLFEGLDTAKVKWEYRADSSVTGVQIDGNIIRWKEIAGSNRRIEILRNNKEPVIAGWRAQAYPSGDSVSVQSYMEFRLQWYPWEKLASLLFEKAYGSQMEIGLYQLKILTESDRSSKN